MYGLGQCHKINWSLWVIKREKDTVWLASVMLLETICIYGAVQTDVDREQCSRSLWELLGFAFGNDTMFAAECSQTTTTSLVKVFAVSICHRKHMLFIYSMVLEGCEPTDDWKCNYQWDSCDCRTTMTQDSRRNHLCRMRNGRLRGQHSKRLFESLHSSLWGQLKNQLKLSSSSCRRVGEWKSLWSREVLR